MNLAHSKFCSLDCADKRPPGPSVNFLKTVACCIDLTKLNEYFGIYFLKFFSFVGQRQLLHTNQFLCC